jgi:RNA polymerase-binding transcription factor DksA
MSELMSGHQPKLIDGTRNPWYKCATFVTGNPLIGNWNGGEGVETMLTREEFIANERRKLLDEEQQTSAALERLHESLREEVDVDAEEGDPDLIEREKNVALANQQEYKLEGIRAALRAIDKGTYGLCERCGKEIGTPWEAAGCRRVGSGRWARLNPFLLARQAQSGGKLRHVTRECLRFRPSPDPTQALDSARQAY